MERIEYERMHAVEDRMWWYRGLRALVAELSPCAGRAAGAGPVLDAGCGTGGMLARLGSTVRVPWGWNMTRCRSPCRHKAGAPVAAVRSTKCRSAAGACRLPVARRVVPWRRRAGTGPKEAHRCLRPGAIAFFNLPAYGWLLSAHDRRVHNVRRFSRSQARTLLAGCGFKVLKSSYWNTLLFPLMLLHRVTERHDAQATCATFRAGSTRCSRWRSRSSGWRSVPASPCRSAARC